MKAGAVAAPALPPKDRAIAKADEQLLNAGATAARTMAERDGAVFRMVSVANPLGEVTIRGEIRQHQTVRRVPRWQEVVRPEMFAACEWYAERIGLAMAAEISAQNLHGASGGATDHVPRSERVGRARRDVAWADAAIGGDLLAVWRRVMIEELSFSEIARLGVDAAPRRLVLGKHHIELADGKVVQVQDVQVEDHAARAARVGQSERTARRVATEAFMLAAMKLSAALTMRQSGAAHLMRRRANG